jgi:type IV pilus assembly protein PilA
MRPQSIRPAKTASQHGFTLIELMIVAAIIGILAAIAIPMYSNYTSRAHAAATVTDLEPYEVAVALCVARQGKATGCNAGTQGIPEPKTSSGFASAPTIVDGVITGTSTATSADGKPLAFTATPKIGSNSTAMAWVLSGPLCDGGLRGLAPGEAGCP